MVSSILSVSSVSPLTRIQPQRPPVERKGESDRNVATAAGAPPPAPPQASARQAPSSQAPGGAGRGVSRAEGNNSPSREDFASSLSSIDTSTLSELLKTQEQSSTDQTQASNDVADERTDQAADRVSTLNQLFTRIDTDQSASTAKDAFKTALSNLRDQRQSPPQEPPPPPSNDAESRSSNDPTGSSFKINLAQSLQANNAYNFVSSVDRTSSDTRARVSA